MTQQLEWQFPTQQRRFCQSRQDGIDCLACPEQNLTFELHLDLSQQPQQQSRRCSVAEGPVMSGYSQHREVIRYHLS